MRVENKVFAEGIYFNKYLDSRFNRNKNALVVVTGSTGSGKTYTAIRFCELYYKHKFKKGFPIENICFSLLDVTDRLKQGTLQRGELLILEEAGANLGSADWQSKVNKIFNYILQSFRSLNIGLIMTLPVMTMLNKQARQLVHVHITTEKIIVDKKICRVSAKLHQLNQHTGKSYWKCPRLIVNGVYRKIKLMEYSLADQDLLNAYEKKKEKFVLDLISGFEEKTKSKEEKTWEYYEERIKDFYHPKITQTEISEKLNIPQQTIAAQLRWLGFKDYMDRKYKLGLYAPKNEEMLEKPQKTTILPLSNSN